jgi:hypothetical protein
MPMGIDNEKLNRINNLMTRQFFDRSSIAAGIRKIAKRFSQNFNKPASESGIGSPPVRMGLNGQQSFRT